MARKSPENTLKDADYRALAAFRHQLRQFLLFSENAARDAGLQPRHHQALLAIKGFADSTVGDLATQLGIKSHSAAELVNRLVAAKLVRRTADLVDRRRVHLALTAAAEKKLEALTLAHRAELRRLATLWGPLLKGLAMDAVPAPDQPRANGE
jgi:DNA-binding MarR family transcriptional regulator